MVEKRLGLRIERHGAIVGTMPRDETAHAANWRTVLLVDLLMAGLVAAGGAAVLVTMSVTVGALMVAAALTYGVAIIRRGRRWARLRREAGL